LFYKWKKLTSVAMKTRPMYKLNLQMLAKRVREERGNRTLREIAAELDIDIATLSRVENAKLLPDYHNLGVICHWLGDNPGIYFLIEEGDSDDPITTQLRAIQSMSVETASAFMDVIRAAYETLLEQSNNADMA
jgi:transcriptional regulator with XRE-family HTH domain